jgi:hypothetical protein
MLRTIVLAGSLMMVGCVPRGHRRNLREVVDLDLHGYSVERNVSGSYGNFVFNSGEWQAKLGDQQLHGYYTGRRFPRSRFIDSTQQSRNNCGSFSGLRATYGRRVT